MTRVTPEQRRKRDLAAIHASRNQIGMAEDAYRALVARVADELKLPPTDSSGKLNERGRGMVLARLRELGGNRPRSTPVGQHPGKPHNLNREPMLQKIEAQLADMKAPWSYADAIARQMFRVQRVAWLRKPEQLAAVVAALDNEGRKRNTLEFIDRTMRELGMTEDALKQRAPNLPKNWRSLKAWGNAVADALGASAELLREQEGDAP